MTCFYFPIGMFGEVAKVGSGRICSIIQRNQSHEAKHEEENKVERHKSSDSWNFVYLLES